jgi:hypothetical protein
MRLMSPADADAAGAGANFMPPDLQLVSLIKLVPQHFCALIGLHFVFNSKLGYAPKCRKITKLALMLFEIRLKMIISFMLKASNIVKILSLNV